MLATRADSRSLLDNRNYQNGVERHFNSLYANSLKGVEANAEGPLVDLPGGGLVDVDAVDRAGLGAHVAGDALIGLELVDAAVARGEGKPLLGILDGDGLLEAVFERDLHPDGDGGHVVVDVF